MPHMAIRNVGVLGCGLMGSGIVQVAAQAGFPTVVAVASQELLDRGLGGLRKNLDALVAQAQLDERARDDIRSRIRGVVGPGAFRDSDLVNEAITENQPLKNETFARLDRI